MKRLIKIIKYRLALKSKFFKRNLLSDKEQRKMDIAELRANFMFFGYDMSDMTDEEVMDGVKNVAKTFSCFGFSAEDAKRSIEILREETK